MEPSSLKQALRRGAFHALVGLAVVSALLLLPRPVTLIALGAVTAAVLCLEIARLRVPTVRRHFSVFFGSLMRGNELSGPTSSGYFLVSCLLTVLAFPRGIAVLSILFLSLGDPAATAIGMWKGRTRLWGRSFEGDAACLAACLVVAFAVSFGLREPPLVVAVVGAVVATVIQSLPIPVNDNFTISLGSALAMIAASAV